MDKFYPDLIIRYQMQFGMSKCEGYSIEKSIPEEIRFLGVCEDKNEYLGYVSYSSGICTYYEIFNLGKLMENHNLFRSDLIGFLKPIHRDRNIQRILN